MRPGKHCDRRCFDLVTQRESDTTVPDPVPLEPYLDEAAALREWEEQRMREGYAIADERRGLSMLEVNAATLLVGE